MIPRIIKRNLLAFSVSIAFITGCGGSGGGSNSIAAPSGSISGVAAKGVMKNAVVKIFKLKATGEKDGDAVVETKTSDSGTYSFTGLASTGTLPILVELSVDPGKTTMVCDALAGCGTVQYGGDITLPDDFVLRAILPSYNGNTATKAQVTPFSDFATSLALEQTNVDAAVVQSALSEVNNLVGLNIQTVEPIDTTKTIAANISDKQQQYGLLNAAIADLAFRDSDGNQQVDANDLRNNLQDFSNDFIDGKLGGTGDKLQPRELFESVRQQAVDPRNSGLSKNARDQAEAIATIQTGQIDTTTGELDPIPSTTTNATEVEQAKALVTDTREWVNSLIELESPANAFGTDLETLNTTLDRNTEAVFLAFTEAFEQVANAITDADNRGVSRPTTLTITSSTSGQAIGNVSITDNSTATTTAFAIKSTGNGISGVDIDISLALNQLVDDTPIPAGTTTFTTSGNVSNNNVQLTMDTTVSVVSTATFDPSNDADPQLSQATIKGGLEIAAKENDQLTGAKIVGKTDIELVRLTNNNGAIANTSNLSLKKLALTDLTVTNAQGASSTGLTASLVINNAESFDTFNFLSNIDNGSATESDTNFINATLTIGGTLKLSGRPEVSANLSLNKTGLEKGDATLTLGYEGRSLQIAFSGDNNVADSGTGTLTITNPEGASLIVTATDTTTGSVKGSIKVNDKTIGTIEESNNIFIIRYNDGSFESL